MLVFCLADPKVIGGGHERRQKTRPQPGRSTRDGGWQCEARTAKHGNLLTTERVCWHRGAHTAKQKLVRILITKIPPILITKTNVVFCGTWPGELLRHAFFKTVPRIPALARDINTVRGNVRSPFSCRRCCCCCNLQGKTQVSGPEFHQLQLLWPGRLREVLCELRHGGLRGTFWTTFRPPFPLPWPHRLLLSALTAAIA